MARDQDSVLSLQDYMKVLEKKGELIRVSEPVSTVHEMTEIHNRVLRSGGPSVLFEKPLLQDGAVSGIPVLVNLFGTIDRVASGLGTNRSGLKQIGHFLSAMKQPEPPKGFMDAVSKIPVLKSAMSMSPEIVRRGPVQQKVLKGKDVDLSKLPIQTCWPGEPAPLITWPLVITRAPNSEKTESYNVGVYRMQVLGRDKTIMRWMEHRGGAQHHRLWQEQGKDMPCAVVIGADPSTILSGVTPVPDDLSEYHFAGLLKKEKLQLVSAKTQPLLVPAHAEIVLEGFISKDEIAEEGPYGDHTGYYNAVESFPTFKITAITMREKPVYLSTFTGRPPDEPSVLSEALNDVFLPLMQQQFPEIVDCYLPPEACSYRIAVVSIKKRYAGHAKRIMMGMWSHLYQFSYTKMVIVVDEDIDARNWKDVMWAVSTRMDPSRDLTVIEGTPMDYLDFASPKSGLGGKLGIDATNKMGNETSREWGTKLEMSPEIIRQVTEKWKKLGLK